MPKRIIQSIAMLCFIGHGFIYLPAQNSGFSKTYLFDARSTIFHKVRQLDDRLIVVGEMGTDTFGNNGIFVADIDTFGNVRNLRIFQDPANEEHLSLNYNLTPWDGLIISSEKKILVAGTIRRSLDLFLLELDENMEVELFKVFETSFNHSRYTGSILELNSQYYVIGFYQTDALDFNLCINKIDSDGNLIWEKTYGTGQFDDAANSAIIEEGGITILGSESHDPTPSILNDHIFYDKLFHIDTAGNILWSLKGKLNETGARPTSLNKIGSNYYYITSPFLQEAITLWHYKPQVVRRDSAFNLIWKKDYGEFYYNNELLSLIIGPDGYLYGAGYIPDGWTWGRVMKIDPEDGEVIWEARDTAFVIPGWGSRNRMQGITVLPSGSVIAVGYTVDHSFHENGLLYKVTKDGCIDTLCTTVAIEDLIRREDSRVHVYPNPASDDIFIDLEEPYSEAILNIYDMQGRLTQTIKLSEGKNKVPIDKSRFIPGLYLWRAASSDGKFLGVGKLYIHL